MQIIIVQVSRVHPPSFPIISPSYDLRMFYDKTHILPYLQIKITKHEPGTILIMSFSLYLNIPLLFLLYLLSFRQFHLIGWSSDHKLLEDMKNICWISGTPSLYLHLLLFLLLGQICFFNLYIFKLLSLISFIYIIPINIIYIILFFWLFSNINVISRY